MLCSTFNFFKILIILPGGFQFFITTRKKTKVYVQQLYYKLSIQPSNENTHFEVSSKTVYKLNKWKSWQQLLNKKCIFWGLIVYHHLLCKKNCPLFSVAAIKNKISLKEWQFNKISFWYHLWGFRTNVHFIWWFCHKNKPHNKNQKIKSITLGKVFLSTLLKTFLVLFPPNIFGHIITFRIPWIPLLF